MPERGERNAEIGARLGGFRLDRDGPLQQRHGVIEVPLLRAGQAEIMQGAEMVRLDLEHGAIKLLGLVEPPGAMTRHRLFKRLRGAERAPPPDRGFCVAHVVLLAALPNYDPLR